MTFAMRLLGSGENVFMDRLNERLDMRSLVCSSSPNTKDIEIRLLIIDAEDRPR